MLLELLQHLLWIEARIGIIEAGDEPQRDNVVRAAVNPGASIFFRRQRPAHGVHDFPRSDTAGRDFPEFLDPLTVSLRIAVARERKACDQLLGERTPRALGEDDNFGL